MAATGVVAVPVPLLAVAVGDGDGAELDGAVAEGVGDVRDADGVDEGDSAGVDVEADGTVPGERVAVGGVPGRTRSSRPSATRASSTTAASTPISTPRRRCRPGSTGAPPAPGPVSRFRGGGVVGGAGAVIVGVGAVRDIGSDGVDSA